MKDTTYSKSSSERAGRMFVLTIAALMVFGVFSGIAGIVSASSGSFTAPHSDLAVDTDMPPNGLYDELIVSASVDVTGTGIFYLIGDLYDNSGMFMIDTQFAMANLGLGAQWIDVTFPGFIIRQSGYDGPYQVGLALFDDLFIPLDFGSHTTSAYLATDFEGPDAYFTPPHSDHGIDNDGDTLWDLLIVGAEVTVNVSGNYEIDATLLDAAGMTFIDFQVNSTFLSVGTHTLDFGFLGYLIRGSGIDGPYRVELYLYDSMFNFLHNDTYFTNPYPATDFTFPPVTFLSPHSDWGWDINGNLLYEFLVVSASVDVTTAGNYSVDGFTAFGWTQNATYLSAGIQTVDLKFYGFQIFNFGVDGPYLIDLYLYDEFWNLLDNDTHITAAYLFTDFEPNPPCVFTSPHWDYGLDTDGDGDFNYLVVNADVTVGIAGYYRFWPDLWDQMSIIWITDVVNYTWLDVGTQTVDLLFSGLDIYDSGIDGPYWVDLYVFDEFGSFLDYDGFQTNPYLFTDFDPPPAYFNPPHSDYGLDTDVPPDGVFNFLVVDASIMVNDPGFYAVNSVLLDMGSNVITSAMRIVNLTTGPQTVPLEFSGLAINRFGSNGPYIARMGLLEFDEGFGAQIDQDQHMTGAYSYTDFTSLPISTLWGYANRASDGTPVDSADVMASNYTHRWLEQTVTDATGYYEFDAFDGDFYVVFDEADLQADIAFATVAGSTEVTTSLVDPVPNSNDVSVIWSDWDNADLSGAMEGHHDNATTRFMIDIMIGNQDGLVNQTELDLFMTIMGATGSLIPQNTTDILYVDGIHYDLVPGTDSIDFSSLLGPIVPATPMTITMSGSFVSNTTIPVSNIHWIELNADYDTDEDLSLYGATLPPGFTLWGHIPETNVSVSGLATPNVVIDPLGDPDPMDTIDSVWVNLTVGQGLPDTNAPLLSNVMLNDQLGLTYALSGVPPVVYLNATVDDTGRGDMIIGGANYTIGAQNWPGTDMNPSDGTFNGITEDVTITIAPPTVTTGYCVYGWDIVPNFDTVGACATITVLDDIAPEINNVLIDGVPFATYFLSTAPATVPLNATVDDGPTGGSLIDGANYTTPLVDSWPGIPMIAVDGGFADIWEDITADIPVPTSAGTYDYFVHAWDAAMNYNDSAPSVRITIVDDVEPDVTGVLLNGLPAVSVMPGTTVVVEATIDDTGGRGDTPIQGANYTIEFDWLTSTSMDASDGTYDQPTEPVTSSVPNHIDTTGWPDADYWVCVYGWDSVPNYNVADTCALLNVSSVDDQPPFVLNVLLNDQATLDVYPGDMVYLNATIDDTLALQSNIGGANYTVGVQNWPGTPLFPFDGTFDQPTEDVNVTINTTGWAVQPYQICVYGWDVVLNNNTIGACATLNVQAPPDTQPPTILNQEANPDPQAPDENVEITADVTDNVDVDEVWIDIIDPDGNPVGNYTMSPGTGDEYSYENDFPDEGEYTYTIWANDTSNNWASASGSFDVQELTPPTIDVVVDPEQPDVGETVTFEATVDDASGVDRVRIEIVRISDALIVLSNRSMDDLGGGVYGYEFSFDEAGDYDYKISARDENGNWNEVQGTITVAEKAAPSFLEEYWWLLVLIIVIVVVVAVVGLMLRRKPKVAEVPPAEEELPPPPEEPAEAPTEAPAEEPTEAPAEEETPPPPEEEPKGPEMLEDVEG